MAVSLDCVSVIVRRSAVDRRFPGGLDGFARQELSNLTEDDHLLRVSFMSTRDAREFVATLEAAGLRDLGPDADSDIAVLMGVEGSLPPWLSVGLIGEATACWANGNPPGEIAFPEAGCLLRCPRTVYDSLAGLVGRCGAEIHGAGTAPEPGFLAGLRCSRGPAEVLIDVIDGGKRDSPVGIWVRRQLARRAEFREDVALIRDLEALLVREGAEG